MTVAVSEIQAGHNGPYRMAGGVVTLIDADGNETVLERPRLSLCRCGQSATKPLCDGTHKTNGFVAEEMIIRWSDQS